MIKFLIQTPQGDFDFDNPIDLEFPNKKTFESLTPNTIVYLVDYDTDLELNFAEKKDIMQVMRSILSLYPNMFFCVNTEFFENDSMKEDLLNTALKSKNARAKSNKNTNETPQDFELRAREYCNTPENNL